MLVFGSSSSEVGSLVVFRASPGCVLDIRLTQPKGFRTVSNCFSTSGSNEQGNMSFNSTGMQEERVRPVEGFNNQLLII